MPNAHSFLSFVDKLRNNKKTPPQNPEHAPPTPVDTLTQTAVLQKEKDQLISERNMLSTILSDITEGVIGIDLNCKITILNRSAEKMTGYASRQVVGRVVSDVIKILENNQELPSSVYCPKPATPGLPPVTDKSNITLVGNNNQATINLSVKGFQDGDRLLGFILTITDVTEQKQLEEMKLDFVSMAAHELRTPITAIKGYFSAFMEENKDKLNADQKMLLGKVGIASEQLLALVENLLNVSRVERGAFTVMLESVDWLAATQMIIDEFQERAKQKNIDLQFLPPPGILPPINADKIRINEVLANLISNAINYTPANGSIKVWIEQQGNDLVTHVKDTGSGIPKEAQAHLFTKFYRVTTNLEQKSKGTGLGLYISKAIIQLHRGKIWVDSEFGQGSVFSFSVAIYQAPPTITLTV